MGSQFSTLLDPEAAAASEEASSAVVRIHAKQAWNDHWTAIKSSNKLLVIDFSATWCGPCRFIEPAFKSLASRFTDASFVKIDVDELSDVAQQWRVQAMPTFVLVKGGRELSRVVGANKEELQRKVVQFHT